MEYLGVFILIASFGSLLLAQSQIFPLDSVKPGLKGYGKTIFKGTKVERFDFEILGTLEKIRPDQSIILAMRSWLVRWPMELVLPPNQ